MKMLPLILFPLLLSGCPSQKSVQFTEGERECMAQREAAEDKELAACLADKACTKEDAHAIENRYDEEFYKCLEVN